MASEITRQAVLMAVRRWLAAALMALLLFFLPQQAVSQGLGVGPGSTPSAATPAPSAPKAPDLADQLRASLEPLLRDAEALKVLLNKEGLSEEQLINARDEALRLRSAALDRVVRVQPQLSELNSRLDRLPPPPAEGQPDEPAEISEERQRLSDVKARATVSIRDAELLSVQSNALVARTVELRRDLFLSSLLKRQPLNPDRFAGVLQEAPSALALVWATLVTWIVSLVQFRLPSVLAAVILCTAIGAGLLWLRKRVRNWVGVMDDAEPLPPLQRVVHAFLSTVLTGLVFAFFLLAVHLVAQQSGLYRFRIDQMVPALLWVLAGIFFVSLLLRAILGPRHPNRRMVAISDKAANRLFGLGLSMAAVYGADVYLTEVISIFGLSVNLTVAKTLLSTILIALIMVAAVTTRLNEPSSKTADGGQNTNPGFRGWNPILYLLVWVALVAIVALGALGYVTLSRFIAGQIVITGTIVATMFIGYQAARALGAQGALASTGFGQSLLARGRSTMGLDQIGLILSVLINLVVTVIGVPLILLQWGRRFDEITAIAATAFSGFSVGGVEISFGRIFLAVVVFILGVAVTRLIQRWFEGKVLVRTTLDSGVKNSVRAGLGYLGYFIAGLIAFSWAGLNLSNIAIIAGALSVGIGFGLQNIVNNFVSGLIMLVERPIKAGDIINVGGVEGFVRKINVRATEMETFDRQSVIIPNSVVINTAVANWMHVDHVRRVIIRVGVAYGSDVEKVRKVLLQVLEGDERIAPEPEPYVYFANFGASSLDFELRFFIHDLMEVILVETDVRFRIDAVFRENEIEIPFP
ncbi:MAG: mechanosensitive ion channel domain-containing protein, partial [Pseudomonadota bacterium]